jgi:hypothetical protein
VLTDDPWLLQRVLAKLTPTAGAPVADELTDAVERAIDGTATGCPPSAER